MKKYKSVLHTSHIRYAHVTKLGLEMASWTHMLCNVFYQLVIFIINSKQIEALALEFGSATSLLIPLLFHKGLNRQDKIFPVCILRQNKQYKGNPISLDSVSAIRCRLGLQGSHSLVFPGICDFSEPGRVFLEQSPTDTGTHLYLPMSLMHFFLL